MRGESSGGHCSPPRRRARHAPEALWRRVLAKVLPARGAPVSAGANSGPPSSRLASLEEVEELMRPTEMKLGALVGEAALTRFFSAPGAGTSYEQTWTRVLSLEYALRALERAGVSRVKSAAQEATRPGDE